MSKSFKPLSADEIEAEITTQEHAYDDLGAAQFADHQLENNYLRALRQLQQQARERALDDIANNWNKARVWELEAQNTELERQVERLSLLQDESEKRLAKWAEAREMLVKLSVQATNLHIAEREDLERQLAEARRVLELGLNLRESIGRLVDFGGDYRRIKSGAHILLNNIQKALEQFDDDRAKAALGAALNPEAREAS